MNLLSALTATPQTKRDLAIRLDWYDGKGRPDTRRVELEIARYRDEGVPICSDDSGYWYAQSSAEVLDTYRRLRRRYIGQAVRARALLRAAKRMEMREQRMEQGELWAA